MFGHGETASLRRRLELRLQVRRRIRVWAAPEVGKRQVEENRLVVFRDKAYLEQGIKLVLAGNIDQREALGQLDDAPRPDVEAQLPEQPRKVNEAGQNQVATHHFFIGQWRFCGNVHKLCSLIVFDSAG